MRALLAPAVTACATLSSPQASISCQMADVATTAVAINAGAHEANPIMSGILKGAG